MRKELKVQLIVCQTVIRDPVLLAQELIKLLPVLSAGFAIPAKRVCAPQSLLGLVVQPGGDPTHPIQSTHKLGLQPELVL